MPDLFGATEKSITLSGFNFSAAPVDELGSTEYTIVQGVLDVSGSVAGFIKELENCMVEVMKSCQKSPRADNLLLRWLTFEDSVEEHHGFTELRNLNESAYKGKLQSGGMTALYDATLNGLESMQAYGNQLFDMEYDCNGLIVVVTDGIDNMSAHSPDQIKKAIEDIRKEEKMESLLAILIGVGIDQDVKLGLQNFKDDAGFDQFLAIADANKNTIAKMANFISQSVSSSSQALGSGGASQPINPASIGF